MYEKGVWEAIKQQVAEKGATQFYGALLRWARCCWGRGSRGRWDGQCLATTSVHSLAHHAFSPPPLPLPRSVGLLYHLYNQFAFNTLARVSPVSHGVCNVVKRVAIIATSGERGGLGGLQAGWASHGWQHLALPPPAVGAAPAAAATCNGWQLARNAAAAVQRKRCAAWLLVPAAPISLPPALPLPTPHPQCCSSATS